MSKPGEAGDRDQRRLDEVFGEVLPQATSDERAHNRSGGDRSELSERETWMLSNRPPHHGT